MARMRVLTVVVLMVAAGACGEATSGSGAESTAGAQPPATSAATEAPSAEATAAAAAGPVDAGASVVDRGTKDLSDKMAARLTLTMDDSDGLFFEPTFVKLQPGAVVKVKVVNVGFADHNISIDSLKIDKDVAADAKAAVTVTMPEQDALRFYCSLHPGMAGAFYSEDGQDVQS